METLFTFQNILRAYHDARKNKRNTINVLRFEYELEKNLLSLLSDLKSGTYHQWKSVCFVVEKPVIREIFASEFRDRVVHHLYVRFLESFTDKKLIYDSYACRTGKGALKASDRLMQFIRKASFWGNINTYYCKLDISGFFMSIDQNILFWLIIDHVEKLDIVPQVRQELTHLSKTIIFYNPTESYTKKGNKELFLRVPKRKSLFYSPPFIGMPIGNLTSQFFANIYLDELDRFVKHRLKVQYYLRYVDDFVLLNPDKTVLYEQMTIIRDFLKNHLWLTLHEKKTIIESTHFWIKFVWYIHKYGKRIALRKHINSTKECLKEKPINLCRLASYKGYFSHTDNSLFKNFLDLSFQRKQKK